MTLKKPTAHKRDRVAASLRTLAGQLAPGDRMPSVPDLERQFGVATGTVEAAIDLLRREGVVVRRRGAGTYVAEPPAQGPAARASQTGTLAVLTIAEMPFFRYCVDALTAQANREGLKVVCHYLPPDISQEESLADARELEPLRPAGFLVFSHRLAPVALALQERGHRTVLVGTLPPGPLPPVPCVYGDQEHGAYLATRHLLDLGHRRIAVVERVTQTRRWQGCEKAIREEPPGSVTIALLPSNWGQDNALVEFLRAAHAPTALLPWSDNDAIALLHRLRREGVDVPRDLSIVSYDSIPGSAHSQPPLDTVDGHVEVQVRHALALIRTPPQGGHVPAVAVTPTLVCRESCARPRD